MVRNTQHLLDHTKRLCFALHGNLNVVHQVTTLLITRHSEIQCIFVFVGFQIMAKKYQGPSVTYKSITHNGILE